MPARKPSSGHVKKSSLASATDAWLASKDGRSLADGQVGGFSLRNRLAAAFMSGWNAAKADQTEAEDSDAGRVKP